MKNILITGATGFIGKHLINMLKKSDEYKNSRIILMTGFSSVDGFECLDHANYKFTKDIFNSNKIESLDVVFHLGAFTPKSGADANNIEKSVSNIGNTLHLIMNFPNIPKKFIFTSTIDVYGAVDGIIDEYTQTIPSSLYGESKLFCEKILIEWATNNDVVLQILRIGHIYGPGEDAYKKIIPSTIKKILNNENPVIWTSGCEKRSYLYIEDACNFIIKASMFDKYMTPINIVSSVPKSVNEIVTTIIELSKKDIQIEIKNNFSEGIKDFVFDASKMNSLLGFETTTLQKGLRLEYEYFSK